MKIFYLLLSICETFAIQLDSCSNVTDLHRDLFTRAFTSTNYARIDTITTNYSFISAYLENVLQKFYKLFERPIFVQRIDLNEEEAVYDFFELFSWNGEKLPLRSTQSDAKMVIHNEKRLKLLRKDESDYTEFIVVESVDILDEFLRGPPRKPFLKTRGRYVIAVLEKDGDYFYAKVTDILKRLWFDYGIYTALVLSTCQNEHLYQYNPFTPPEIIPEGEITTPNLWGEVRKSSLHDLYSLAHWDSNYAFNYNKYPMRSVIFPRKPTAMKWNELPKSLVESYFCDARFYSEEFGGVDGIITGNIFHILNFTAHVFTSPTEYGWQLDNGTYTGSIGDVLYSQAGFSSNGRFITDYGTTGIEFMYPVFFDKFCIIAPKAQQIPQWLAVFRCYSPFAWALIIAVTTFLGLIWYFFKKWTQYLRTKHYLVHKSNEIVSPIHDRIVVSIIDMWLIMTSGVPSLLPYYGAERIFLTGCLLLSLIIGGIFQGSLTTSYSTKSYYKDIHTLRELDESGLAIGSSSRNLANIFESEGNPLFESLQSKFKIRKEPAISQAAFQRDICCIERASDISVIITTSFELADGSPLLRVVEECPRSYHLSFIVRKGWPFLNRFNQIIMRMSEGGLLFQWYEKVEEAIILSTRIQRLKFLKDSLQAFSLNDMQTAFYILGIGCLICVMVFSIELYVGRKARKCKNKRNFDPKSRQEDHMEVIRPKRIY